jgi:hypothetical protein
MNQCKDDKVFHTVVDGKTLGILSGDESVGQSISESVYRLNKLLLSRLDHRLIHRLDHLMYSLRNYLNHRRSPGTTHR